MTVTNLMIVWNVEVYLMNI